MPLQFSAAHSSRITKPRTKNPLLQRRSQPSPFSAHPRRKPGQRPKSQGKQAEDQEDLFDERLPDVGRTVLLGVDKDLQEVIPTLRYVRKLMFNDIPEQRAGMNSTRIAEVLNFRRSLPPIVTIAQVQAYSPSPTMTERQVVALIKEAVVRKVVVPGRGAGGSAVGEGIVLVEDWISMIHNASGLDRAAKDKLMTLLREDPTASAFPKSKFTPEEATNLMSAGFLTTSSQSWTSVDVFSSPGPATLGTATSLSAVGAQGASGSLAVVGGEGAVHEAGGGGGGSRSTDKSWASTSAMGNFHLSLPNTGPFLRLLTTARSHLVWLLSKSKFREAPVDLLRERWDGGVAPDSSISHAKRVRGEFTGVLPGKTRKWKQFYGLSFEWVLGECAGAGMMELFETGSVGKGVRLTL